jgi:hypothetical protein
VLLPADNATRQVRFEPFGAHMSPTRVQAYGIDGWHSGVALEALPCPHSGGRGAPIAHRTPTLL